ncbi:hypothetical protein HETIRDRAFT_416631 [Heterobasidion irregulare TC 32-1]|uniref:Uncharacterized protein n=1 Tax=Heterobasidion irregulare (strain TC 32-1) TaxID=747525 RepID=W4K9E5_HETIT|nr:uncharacterized protein HETIRDRAFT_416631 [Heterobasidion irregulare TC 32-1]ETW82457.1 hypothetical protein HETIRDRAFT_416631 [Heterobasidion irregulare TC 32-1]
MAGIASIYRGWLGSDGARFPGQDITDLHLTNYGPAGPVINLRQHNLCLAAGVAFAYPERAAAAGAPWVYDFALVPRMRFVDHGLSPPFVPVLGPRVPVPVSFAIANGGVHVLGHRIRWFHHVRETYDLGLIHYYKHSKHRGHGPDQTPTMIVGAGAKHKVCSAIVYGAQVQQYWRSQ